MARQTITIDGVEYVPAECKRKGFLKEFSKKVVFAVAVLWFIVAVYGMAYVWVNSQGIEALFAYIGSPMAGTVIGYMVQIAFVNPAKVKYGGKDNVVGND